jgi:hypothetical protein
VIISNDLVSRIIAQVCRDHRLEFVIRDLLDEEGMEIYFKPASLYADEHTEVSFDQLLLGALKKGEIALGYSIDDEEQGTRKIRLNPERSEILRVQESLSLIVLSETEIADD